jgi:hypothetical protein
VKLIQRRVDGFPLVVVECARIDVLLPASDPCREVREVDLGVSIPLFQVVKYGPAAAVGEDVEDVVGSFIVDVSR